ncbi:MAG: hypothetical protein WCD31_09425 [Gillisia sp.]
MNEICLDREFDNFYCPLTGKAVLLSEGYKITPALLFIYIDEVQDFEYYNQKLRKKFPEHFDRKGEILDAPKLLQTIHQDPEWNQDKLLITYGQTGAASMCFDMGYEEG